MVFKRKKKQTTLKNLKSLFFPEGGWRRAIEYLSHRIKRLQDNPHRIALGLSFGVFASFTDVSADQFGEGSFDKGIYFNIPVFGNLINYSWRPLTKDPGAKLIRKNTLHDLLIRFRPIN